MFPNMGCASCMLGKYQPLSLFTSKSILWTYNDVYENIAYRLIETKIEHNA